ncbi:MAG: zinc ribbon domain-containing protein [Chloroflexota bacterium]|nr:zinc ribbon domain-containing protein [Chloroflexota bacterium]
MSEAVYELVRLGVALSGAFIAMLWLALVLWVYRDAQSRSTSFAVTLLSTVLVSSTFVIGWAVYMLVRPRLSLSEEYSQGLRERAELLDASSGDLCPRCHARLQLDYRLCPNCGLEVKQPCDMCKRPVRPSWNLCPYCGHTVHQPLAAHPQHGRAGEEQRNV